MEGRISITFVVVFWLITMTWLMWTKVLPPLLLGDPPDYKAIVEDEQANSAPAAWVVSYNGKPLGFAANRLERSQEMSRIHSYVSFERLPLDDVPFLPMALKAHFPQLSSAEVHAHNTLLIDSLGRLLDIESRLRISGVEVLRLTGAVAGSKMHITVSSRFLSDKKKIDVPLGSDSLLGDQLSPHARLPGLHVGQEWAVPVYSVMRSLMQKDPIEIAYARVEREDLIAVGGEKILSRLVVLGSDPGAGDREETGRMWVAMDGTVLRQEMRLPFGGRLRFERRDEGTSAAIYERIQRKWLRNSRSSNKPNTTASAIR